MIWSKGTQFTCFTGTKQHDLLLLVQQYNIGKRHDLVERYSVFLFYRYKSTDTDAREA
jgi:hypothetical protein